MECRPSVAVAKVTPPRTSPAAVPIAVLETLVSAQSPVLWLAAPAGSGKTTLASMLARRRGDPCAWLRLDEADADAASFLVHLTEALRVAGIVAAPPTRPISREHLPALTTYARLLLRELLGGCGDRGLLVLDDLHRVGSTGEVVDLLPVLVEELPPAIQLVVTSRCGPPESLARHLANGTVQQVPAADMRLNVKETAALIASWGVADANRLAEPLRARTQGWVAALVLARSGVLTDPARCTDPCSALASETLQAYIEREVLRELPTRTLDILGRLAWLPHVDEALCSRLTGDDAGSGAVRELAERGCLVQEHVGPARPGQAVTFVLHPLLADAVQALVLRAEGEEGLRARKAAAAEALAARGELDAAMTLWLDSERYDAAEAAIITHAPALFAAARLRTLERWLASFPSDGSRSPWLDYWRGLCLLMRDPSRGREILVRACDGFRGRGDSRGLYLALSYAIGSYFMAYSSSHRPREWIDEIERLGVDFDGLGDADTQAGVALSVWYGLFLVEPDHPDLALWETRLARLIRTAIDPSTKLRIGMMLSKHYYYTGRYRELWALRDLLIAERRDDRLSPYGRLVWYLFSLPDHWSRGDLAGARAELEAGLEESTRSGIHLLDNHMRIHAASACLLAGALDEAASRLAEVALDGRSSRHMEVWHLYLDKAWHACLVGRRAEARGHAQVCFQAAMDMGGVAPQAFARVALAYLAFADGDLAALREQREALAALARRAAGPLIALHLGLVDAGQCLLEERTESALAALRRGLAAGREAGIVHFLWAVPEVLTPLCELALEHDIETEYVRDIVRARRLRPSGDPARLERWPWPVRIHALGRFEVEVDGHPLGGEGKAQTRTLDLLRVLVACGPNGASTGRLSDRLWPDADGDAAQHALESGIYRLRKLIGKESVIVHDGTVRLAAQRCWVDAWALEASSVAADEAASGQVARRLQEGDFLPDRDDLPWTASRRRALERRARRLESERGR